MGELQSDIPINAKLGVLLQLRLSPDDLVHLCVLVKCDA